MNRYTAELSKIGQNTFLLNSTIANVILQLVVITLEKNYSQIFPRIPTSENRPHVKSAFASLQWTYNGDP